MSAIDKTDVAEALAATLDDTKVEGLGTVLLGESEDGVMVMQTWPNGDNEPSVDFLVRITRYRQRPQPSVQEHDHAEGSGA